MIPMMIITIVLLSRYCDSWSSSYGSCFYYNSCRESYSSNFYYQYCDYVFGGAGGDRVSGFGLRRVPLARMVAQEMHVDAKVLLLTVTSDTLNPKPSTG